MDEVQNQILVNQLTIMEALIAVFHASNSDRYDCACRNLELRAEDTYRLLKEKSFFNFDSPVVRIDEKSYNKAIDEFAEKIHKEFHYYRIDGKSVDYWFDRLVDEIAEQMKGGAE